MVEHFYGNLKQFGFFLGVVLLFGAGRALADGSGTIRGKALDRQTKSALPGANVLVKGTSIGASTDLNGDFIINNAPSGEQTLVVSYVGYASSTIKLDVPAGGNLVKMIYLAPNAV